MSSSEDAATGRPRSPAPERYVDTHVHFWDHDAPDLDWPMLAVDFQYPLHRFDDGRYAAQEHRAESSAMGVVKVVHVQAAVAADPATETAWLQRMAEEHEWPNAIVGSLALGAADAPEVVERHARHASFRGIRDFEAVALGSAAVDRGLDALAAVGASCELLVPWPRYDEIVEVAARHPDVVFVLGHCGAPRERTPEYFAAWSSHLREIARIDNLVCKIASLGIADPAWTVASLRPWVLECIESFGPDRCMFGSNWPVDKLFATYEELAVAFRTIVDDLTTDERRALFSATAERVYRI